MQSRKIPISYAQLKRYCSNYKKTEAYSKAEDNIDCRKDAFTLFNTLVDVGFLTRTGELAEDLREKLTVYTIVHSFTGDQTIFTSNDFESYAQGIAGQANVLGTYLDIPSAVDATMQTVMEALGRNKIKGNFDIKNVDKITPQLERNNNYVFGKISNAGTIEYFTIHRNIVNRQIKQSTDLRALYNIYGKDLDLTQHKNLTYKSLDYNKVIDDQIYDLATDFKSPSKVEQNAAVFYAPVSDTFYISLTGQKIGETLRKTYIYVVKIDENKTTVLSIRTGTTSTPEEDLETLRNEIEVGVFEI